VLVQAEPGFLVEATPTSGAQAGKSFTPYYLDGSPTGSPAVDTLGNIYVTTSYGFLDMFAPGSGQPKASYPVPDHMPAPTTPAIVHGPAIFGHEEATLDAQTAATLPWNRSTSA